MRYAIFSDVHSNLEALESVLAAYTNEHIDKYLCVGDIIGYGANPKECIKIIRDLKILTVAGNHDWASSGKYSIEFFNPYARNGVIWTRKQIDNLEVDYLNNLGLVYKEDNFCIVHGTLVNPDQFGYLFELSDAQSSFEAMQQETLCFVGHTHSPIIFKKNSGKITYVKDSNIVIEPDNQYIINVGSVGQPRDGDNRACFCVYDSKERSVQIKRIEYDIQSAQLKILKAGLPSSLAHRLVLGQ